MPNNQMTPQECKRVLEEIKKDIAGLNYGKTADEALSYALNLIQENEELKNVAKTASQISEDQMYELAKYKLRVEELERRLKNG